MEVDSRQIDVSILSSTGSSKIIHRPYTRGRLDMRVLNSGRRWGNDVPSSLDISRDIDVVGVQVGDRSTKQLQISRRLTALESKFKQVRQKLPWLSHPKLIL
jgi:hypothetical protein